MAEAAGSGDGTQEDERMSLSDEEFVEETESVVRGFMFHRLTSQIEQEAGEGNMSVGNIPMPVLRELGNESTSLEKKTHEEQLLGKTLAGLGDQLEHKYHDQLVDMAKSLGLTSNTAYSTFAEIAKRLFRDGINLGRIVALLCFGYEIAVSVIKTGTSAIGKFLKQIVHFVVTFIVKEKIATWIASQGGWLALLDIREHNSNLWAKRMFAIGIIALCGFAVMKIGSSFRSK